MADKITNDDRNSYKQIISNELDPALGLQYDRYVLLNPELQKFNQETYDKMIDGTTDTFVFAEGEIPDTTPKPISEIGFVDKELFVDSKLIAEMELSDSGLVLQAGAPTPGKYVENILWDKLVGNGEMYGGEDNVLHWSNHDNKAHTVYYQPPLSIGSILYSDRAMTEKIDPHYAESYYAIYSHKDDWKLDRWPENGGLSKQRVYFNYFKDVAEHLKWYGPDGTGWHTGVWSGPMDVDAVRELQRVYAGIDDNFSGGFVKVNKSDGKVISLHHMGYEYHGRTAVHSGGGDLPTINHNTVF
jgi:hypothetical protein